MHFCTTTWRTLRTDWHHVQTDKRIRTLARCGDLAGINAHINTFFAAHAINQRNRVCVPINCPNDWPRVLKPLYTVSGGDRDAAAMLLGALYCRVAIERPEWWWSAPLPIFKNRADPHKWTARQYNIGPEPLRARQRRS